MKYIFVPMNQKYINKIAFDCKYEGIYSFYDMTADKQDLKEFLNRKNWEYKLAVLDEFKELISFYSYYFENGIM